VRLFLNGAIKTVDTAPWPHYPNRMSLATARINCTIVMICTLVLCGDASTAVGCVATVEVHPCLPGGGHGVEGTSEDNGGWRR